MTKLECLPKNCTEYVVLWHGAVKKNSTFLSNPVVEVLIQDLISKECFTVLSSITELDILRVGSCWLNGQKTRTLQKICNQPIVEKVFEFNLRAKAIEVIKFGDKDQNGRIIPTSKFGLPYIDKEQTIKQYSNNTQPELQPYYWASYQDTRLNQLHSIDNEEVLISSLETLTGLYTPSRKEIRRLVLTKSVEEIIQYYIKLSDTTTNGSYLIETNDYSLGSVPIFFLAYIAQNVHTQTIVDRIQDSLEIAEISSRTQKPYPNRYPEILPYHPKGLKFSASGIWIEDQKRFLVLRVNSVIAPEEIPISIKKTITDCQNPDNTKLSNTKEVKQIIKKARETHVVTDEDPGKNAGKNYIVSEIESSVNQQILSEIYEINTTENNKPQTCQYTEQIQEIVRSSAGELFGTKSRVAQLENQTEDEYIDQLNVIRGVWHGLKKLPFIKQSKVKDVTCLMENGAHSNDFYRINILKVLQKMNSTAIISSNKRWLSKFGGRKILLIEITMIDNSKRYILEIERTSKNESYQGVYFTHNFVDQDFIKTVSKYWPKDRTLSQINTLIRGTTQRFPHKKGKNEEWYQKMERLLLLLPNDS